MTSKPYTERPEGNGTNDGDIAIETWSKHLLRENSIITENFGSLMRSELTCPDCGKIVVSFDYQQSLQVALPKLVNFKTIQIMFVPCEIPRLFIKSRDGMSEEVSTKILQCLILVMRPIKFALKVNSNFNFDTIMKIFNQMLKRYSSDLFHELKEVVPSLFHNYVQESNSLYKCDSLRFFEMATIEHGTDHSILTKQFNLDVFVKTLRPDCVIGAYNVYDAIPTTVSNNSQRMLKIVLLQVSDAILIKNNCTFTMLKHKSIGFLLKFNLISYNILSCSVKYRLPTEV